MDNPTEQTLTEMLANLGGFDRAGLDDIGIVAFFILISISLICSIFIATLYLHFYESRATGSQIHRSFPLLGISITAIFICIQFSLPLSLGLLGALSIVRFRTPIKEPEEIGFIMLLIATSIATATFNLYFLLILLVVAILGLVILKSGFRFAGRSRRDGVLVFSLKSSQLRESSSRIHELLSMHLLKGKLDSITKSDDSSIVSYSFADLRPESEFGLLEALSEVSEVGHFNIYFTNRPEV